MAIRDLNSIYEYSPLFRRYSAVPSNLNNGLQQQADINQGLPSFLYNRTDAFASRPELMSPTQVSPLGNPLDIYNSPFTIGRADNGYALRKYTGFPTVKFDTSISNLFAPKLPDYYPEVKDSFDTTPIESIGPLTEAAINGNMKQFLSTNPVKKGLSAGAKGAIGAGLGLVGSIGGKLIADGYDDGGVGNTVAGVGTAVGSIASLVPGVGTVAGAAIGAASQLIGGAITRGFGVKRNEKNIAAVNSNIDNMKATGNLLASANTYDSVLSAANNMSGGLGFSNGAIAKNGWFNSKGDKIANDLRNSQNTALAMQGQGLATGVKNADLEQKNRTANSFIAAYGGDLTRDNGMGAIDYGFMSDLLANKRKQLEVKDRLPGMAGMPSTLFALGGDVQTHGADFTNGAAHIDAGYSHEENPNQGVQVGVDEQGTPNLVEEGEVIFNDYVYSKRIELDDEAKEKFHISKKREITYADMAKKLEKESEERPNDPISQGALKLQMEDLAQEQERQKAEMQAEEAREAFENMSPEEQVALMQQAEAQEQQAAEEEAAMQEQAMAEQQMQGQPSEEEMMQQQMMAQQGGMPMQGMMPPQDTMMAAYGGPLNHYGLGGNLFVEGGAMKWIKQNYPDIGNQKELADAMERWVMKYGAHMGANTLPSFYKKAYNYIAGDGKLFYNTGSDYRKQREHFQKLLDLGLPRNIAFGFAFPEVKGSPSNSIYSNHKSQTFERSKLWKELVGNSSENASSTVPASKQSAPQSSASTPVTQNNNRRSIPGKAELDKARNKINQLQTALSTPGTPQDTLMQAAPTYGGGYSGGYSGYSYTGGGGGGYAAPTTATAPAGVPTIDANGQTVYVPATSQQAAAQAQSTPPVFAAPEYNSNNVRNSILSALGINTASGFQDWMKENNVTGIDNLDNLDWTTLRDNQSFMDAFNKGNSALAHAISQGYDFGQYTPDDLDKVTFATINQGNWKNQGIAGWRGSKDPAWQELLEKGLVDESKDYTPKQIEELLRGTDAFKRGTEWLQKSDKNRLTYLKAILDDDLSPDEAKTYARRFINDDGTWKEGAKTDYNTIFNNPSGRAANPGTYWHTPTELIRGKDTVNWVQKDDGTWDRVLGDVGSGWEKLNTYNWHGQGENGKDLTYNYYKNPNAKAADAAKKEGEKNWQDDYDVLPIHRNENLRYAGLFGPAVGLGLMAAGVGRPDTSGLDAAINAYSNRGSYLPSVRYTDGYYAYRPENPFIGDIAADNASAGTARAITNTTAPYGAQQASLLANAYNDQLARGTRIAQGRQYNNQERLQALNAYKNTDQFNAQAFNANEGVRAQILNQDRQTLANMRMSAAQQKMAADAGWYNSLYGNVSGLFKGISDLGRENAQHNMIADMAANGIFGTLTPNSPVATYFLKWQKKSGVTAEGGKINRKKNKRRGGLTY